MTILLLNQLHAFIGIALDLLRLLLPFLLGHVVLICNRPALEDILVVAGVVLLFHRLDLVGLSGSIGGHVFHMLILWILVLSRSVIIILCIILTVCESADVLMSRGIQTISPIRSIIVVVIVFTTGCFIAVLEIVFACSASGAGTVGSMVLARRIVVVLRIDQRLTHLLLLIVRIFVVHFKCEFRDKT